MLESERTSAAFYLLMERHSFVRSLDCATKRFKIKKKANAV